MVIDPASAGMSTEPRRFSWTERDTLLYALGVGADARTLEYVTENSHSTRQRVLPTFGVIASDASAALALVGEIDLSQVVHGAQTVRLCAPIPPSGSMVVTSSVTDIADKGAGRNAIVQLSSRSCDAVTGDVMIETRSTVVVRNAGGFGGVSGAARESVAFPDRQPDFETSQTTSPTQALLYRLSGDRNPLHSDPWFAQQAGFAVPILHGLCTYGYAGRSLLEGLCGGDGGRFTEMSARFTSPVLPGDTLTTQMWATGEGEGVFRTIADGGDEGSRRIALDDGRLIIGPRPL